MLHRILLSKALDAAFRENQSSENDRVFKERLIKLVESILTPEMDSGADGEQALCDNLKQLTIDLIHGGIRPITSIVGEVCIACGTETDYAEMLEDILRQEHGDNTTNTQEKNELLRHLERNSNEQNFVKMLQSKAYGMTVGRRTIPDLTEYLLELRDGIEAYITSENPNESVEVTDMNDKEKMRDVFKLAKEIESGIGVISFGWQMLNEMLQGGIRPWELMVVPALPGSYKTGMSLSLCAGAIRSGEPHLIDKDKKPIMVRFSFEDSVVNDLQFLFRLLKSMELGGKVSILDYTEDEMTDYIHEQLQANGWSFRILTVNPSDWSYLDIQNTIIQMEADGFEVKLVNIDYLPMLPRTGCDMSSGQGGDIRDLYRRMANFFKAKGIALITPHQMSPSAKKLAEVVEPRALLKKLVGTGPYDGCSKIDQEVDIELMMNKIPHNERWYLGIHLGKHRALPPISDHKKSMFLEFPDTKMPIPFDTEDHTPCLRKLPSLNDNVSGMGVDDMFA